MAPGKSVAIMGANGSGKSTLLKVLSGILVPSEGRVLIGGTEVQSFGSRAAVASRVGIVFQDPHTQLVSPTVEREMAFGMEQLGVPRDVMRARVEDYLDRFDLAALRRRPPQSLSGGEKQRVALASVLAMRPAYLLLDEPTALLDAGARRSLLSIIDRFRCDHGIGIVQVTASPEEALCADRLLAMSEGRVVAEDGPRALFGASEYCERWGIPRPRAAVMASAVRQRGLEIPGSVMTIDEFVGGWERAAREFPAHGETLDDPA